MSGHWHLTSGIRSHFHSHPRSSSKYLTHTGLILDSYWTHTGLTLDSYWTHTGLTLRPHVRNTYRRIHGTYAFGLWYQVKETPAFVLWYQVKETPIMSPCSIDTKCPSSAVRTRVLPALLALLRRSLSQHQSVPRILDVRYARYRHSVWPYLASR